MNQYKYSRNIALVLVMFIALAVCMAIRTLVPMAVLPKLDIPNMVLLSLLALLLDHYLTPGFRRLDVLTVLFAAIAFGLLPYMAGFASLTETWKLALIGGVVFALVTWLFTEMQERLSSGPAAKLAPIFSAVGLYLAFQCFSGMLL